MTQPIDIDRRTLIFGNSTQKKTQPAESSEQYCISSAVVTLLPGRESEVLARLSGMSGVEQRAHEGRKLVLVLEGESSGAVGGLLAQIAVMDGVISANMVFEHTEIT